MQASNIQLEHIPPKHNTTGVTRLLVLDVKKPDYAMLRQQMEANSNGDLLGGELNGSPSSLYGEQSGIWSNRVFGKLSVELIKNVARRA